MKTDFPVSIDQSGLRHHSFEDFVGSKEYQKNIKKFTKEKRAHGSRSYIIGDKMNYNNAPKTNPREDISEIVDEFLKPDNV